MDEANEQYCRQQILPGSFEEQENRSKSRLYRLSAAANDEFITLSLSHSVREHAMIPRPNEDSNSFSTCQTSFHDRAAPCCNTILTRHETKGDVSGQRALTIMRDANGQRGSSPRSRLRPVQRGKSSRIVPAVLQGHIDQHLSQRSGFLRMSRVLP